jgi:DNA-binding HxlR family transcriptional regulator
MASDVTALSTQHSAFLVRTSIMHAVLNILGDPWNIAILRAAMDKGQRFDNLVEMLGVSRPVLSGRMERLCLQGCLAKVAYCESPLRHEYQVTSMGQALRPALMLLEQWNQRWLDAGASSSSSSSSGAICASCGQGLQLRVLCAGCDGELNYAQVKPLFYQPIPAELPAIPTYRRTRNPLGCRDREEQPLAISAEAWLRDRWSCLILGAMLFGLQRYGDMQTVLAIAPNILAGRLELLRQAQVVRRLEDGRYQLRERGYGLYPAIMAMRDWGERWLSPEDRSDGGWRLLHVPCGEWLKLKFVCASCGSAYCEPADAPALS